MSSPAESTARLSIPRVVWAITAVHLVVLVAYSVLLPTYRAPDEPQHVSLAHEYSEGRGYPDWDEGATNAGVLASLREVRFQEDSANLRADEAIDKDDRRSIEELAGDDPPRQINQLTQHPSLYYAVTGSVVAAVEAVAGDPIGSYDLETWIYRVLSLLFVAPLPLLVWRSGALLGLPPPISVAASIVPVAIPQLTHLGGSVNNDTLLLLLFWSVTPAVLRIGDGDLRVRTALWAGTLTGLALLTKGFALLLPLWVGAALAVALWRRGRPALRGVLVAGLAYASTTMAIGGWWWARNVVRYGEVSPSRFDQLVPTRPGFQPDYVEFAQRWADRTVRRYWGWFGWFDVSIPRGVAFAATALCAVAIVLALRRRDPVAGTRLDQRLLLLLPLPLLIANQLVRALASHQRTGGWGGLQGRYWFGAMVGFSILVVLGLATIVSRRARLPLAVFGAGVVLHGLAVVAILSFYWGAPGSPIADRLRAVVAWAPVPGPLIGIGAVVGALVIAVTTFELVRLARASEDDAPPSLARTRAEVGG